MLFLQISTESVHFADYCEVHVLSRTIPHLKKNTQKLGTRSEAQRAKWKRYPGASWENIETGNAKHF